MNYRHLGRSGLKVSELSFGTWVTFGTQLDVDKAAELIGIAFDAGVNFFDAAEVYAAGKAEEILGQVLSRMECKRSDLVISTKIFWGGEGPNDRGLSRKHIMEGVDGALERMDLDYVDLVYCHRPDLETPIEETIWAMTDVIRNGMAFYWGTSEWSAQQIMEAYAVARRYHLIPPVMEQPQYNMFHRDRVEAEYSRLYTEIGLGTTIWSPLAGGLLTGKYGKGIPDGSRPTVEGYGWLRQRFEGDEAAQQIRKVQALEPIAKGLDCTLAQLAIAWCLKNPDVSTVILGASKPEQLKENLAAAGVVPRLTDEVMERIEGILENRPAREVNWRNP